MKFCSNCGAAVTLITPPGDNLPRHVCAQCDTIHYQNPKIVAGCIVTWQNKILLCKRAIEPRYGLWTVPAGFMENGETTLEAAVRETREEACAPVEDLRLYGLFNLPHINQVYVLFRGRSPAGEATPGAESLETCFYNVDAIPWSELAFPVISEALKLYLADARHDRFPTRMSDVIRKDDHSIVITNHPS